MAKIKILFLVLVSIFVSSCTIQKRTLNKGYFVQWHFKNKMASKSVEKEVIIENSSSQLENDFTDTLTISKVDFENEIMLKAEDEVIKQENVISNEKHYEVLFPEDDEAINKVRCDKSYLKKKKDKLEKAKKDTKLRPILLFLISLLFIIVGLLLVIYSFTTKYIGLAIFPGIALVMIGLIVFAKSVNKQLIKQKNKIEKNTQAKQKKVRSKFFIGIVIALILLILLRIYLLFH